MALAIRCDQLLRSGAVPDSTALASLAHVTQPRMTQILNLTLLAPDIQEALLWLPQLVPVLPQRADRDRGQGRLSLFAPTAWSPRWTRSLTRPRFSPRESENGRSFLRIRLGPPLGRAQTENGVIQNPRRNPRNIALVPL